MIYEINHILENIDSIDKFLEHSFIIEFIEDSSSFFNRFKEIENVVETLQYNFEITLTEKEKLDAFATDSMRRTFNILCFKLGNK
jgi:hypothetical protein